MNALNSSLKSEIRQFCKRWKITRLELFGSAVEGNFSKMSDIDLLVDFDRSFHRTLSDQIKMEEELEELFGREVDFIVRKTIENSPNPYKRSILNNTHEIYIER
jgi:predicted nucleotidyltransferase